MNFKTKLIMNLYILSLFFGTYSLEASKRQPDPQEQEFEKPLKRIFIDLTSSGDEEEEVDEADNEIIAPPVRREFIAPPVAGKSPGVVRVARMAPASSVHMHFSANEEEDSAEELIIQQPPRHMEEEELIIQQPPRQVEDPIGDLVQEGINLIHEKDYTEAAAQFSNILNMSPRNAVANYFMGVMVLDGHCKPRAGFSAINYLEISSEEGNAHAANILLGIYYNNNDIGNCTLQCGRVIANKDIEDTFKADAYYTLGVLNANSAACVNYYTQAADLGNLSARYDLGAYYFNTEQFDLSERHLLMAFNAGHIQAAYNLGLIYLKGLGGIEQNPMKAIEVFQRGADEWNQGDCQNMMGALYEEGRFIKEDLEKAKEYFLKAIANGDECAQENYNDVEQRIQENNAE